MQIDGYTTAIPYHYTWQRETSPARLDAASRRAGRAPARTRPDAVFRYLDLGCGAGATLTLLAAACPSGEFVGIDAMPEHVETGERVAREIGLRNLALHALTFEDALEKELGAFDYVVAHGVLSWVSDANRERVLALARRLLAPNGLLYLGYSTEPGWSALRPLQRLLLEAARAHPELAPQAQIEKGLELLAALRRARAGAFVLPSSTAGVLDALAGQPRDYLVHECLNEAWRPMFVTEVTERAARHGLRRVGSVRFEDHRPDFCLRRAQREVIAGLDDPALRELAIDLCVGRAFRREVFERFDRARHREPAAVSRHAGWWALVAPASEQAYSLATVAGTLRFDNPAARAVVAALGVGPQPFENLCASVEPATAGDAANVLDALVASGSVVPADPPNRGAAVARANAWLRARAGGALQLDAQVSDYGVPIPVPALHQALFGLKGTAAARAAAVARRLGPTVSGDSLLAEIERFDAFAGIYRAFGIGVG